MKKRGQENGKDITDLTGNNKLDLPTELKYICKQDKELLQPYPQGQIENPYAGPCYRCPSCNTVYDSSLVKLPRQPRPVNSSIGDIGENTNELYSRQLTKIILRAFRKGRMNMTNMILKKMPMKRYEIRCQNVWSQGLN